MIVYLDASALVKRYVAEEGSDEVATLLGRAEVVGTATISRAEVVAALAKAVRLQVVTAEEARHAVEVFSAEWDDIVRIQVTESLISRAAATAWDHVLRGYDAVHLSAALTWQELLGETITIVTYDHQLWKAAKSSGMVVWPEALG
jgi:predicted nucleic acid-binding protein